MKAILVIDMPINCRDCDKLVRKGCQKGDYRKEERPNTCPLKPVRSLKSGGKDYIIYARQFLYDNLEREIEIMKKGKEIYESNISD